MAFMISIEDLVANALIQNLTINEDKRFLTYSEIESYGAKVVKILIDEIDLHLHPEWQLHILNDLQNAFFLTELPEIKSEIG